MQCRHKPSRKAMWRGEMTDYDQRNEGEAGIHHGQQEGEKLLLQIKPGESKYTKQKSYNVQESKQQNSSE